MKRFIYDFCLIMILLFIGVSIDDSYVYENKQEELKQFENSIDKDENIEKDTSYIVYNQVRENRAGNLAKDTSTMIKSITKSAIIFIHSMFEVITET